MKISYKWLKEFFSGSDGGGLPNPDVLSGDLTRIGLEVEGVENLSKKFEHVVVATVVSAEKHPKADRLKVCQVSDGTENFQIVCGASNVVAGGKYPLAKLGAVLPGGLVIQKAKLRDVESFGMLCSAKELELSGESSGLLELKTDATLGQSFSDYLGLDDVIFEVNVTPNRGDCLSHIGVARDLSVLYDGFVGAAPCVRPLKEGGHMEPPLQIQIKDPALCHRYTCSLIEGVTVKESPDWLKQRLSLLGLRPINNIVDATNLVMLELGHPTHAFDADLIEGKTIQVYPLTSSQKFKTLDGQEKTLEASDLVIADLKKPVALAGIMGGEHSGISNQTKNIILEVASFEPNSIRKTSRRLGLHTDSSHRFERGVAAQYADSALARLTSLILELAGGTLKETHDVYPTPQKVKKIDLRFKRVSDILGVSISESEITSILKKLSFNPVSNAEGLTVTVPAYRFDIEREVDLIEEIVRFYGVDKIPATPPALPLRLPVISNETLYQSRVRNFLVSRGFLETIHYSFCSPLDLKKCELDPEQASALQNPMSEELSVLRTSLLPYLLKTYKSFSNKIHEVNGFFELRPVYNKDGSQKMVLAVLGFGSVFKNHWNHFQKEKDFFDMKGLLEDFFEDFNITSFEFENSAHKLLHPKKSLNVSVHHSPVGFFGVLHPAILKNFDIDHEIFYLELGYSEFVSSLSIKPKKFFVLSEFPPVSRDLSMLVGKEVSFKKFEESILKEKVAYLKEIRLTDVYCGPQVADDKKSLTFSLVYQSLDKTLTDDEVNKVHFDLVAKLQNKFGAQLR